MSKLQIKNVNMTEGNIFRSVIKFTIPAVLAGMLQVLFNAADLAVVGHFSGTVSEAAVGASAPIINLIVNSVMGMSVGTSITLTRCLGANDKEGAHKIVHTSVLLSLFIGGVIAVSGLFVSKPILQLTKCSADAFDMAVSYLTIYLLGAPAVLVYNFSSAVLRAKGDTKRPLIYLAVSGVLNVILNIIFVVFFNMAAAGVALATTLTQILAALLTLRCLISEDDETKLYIIKMRLYRKELLQIIKYGLPSGITSAMYSIANVTIQSYINSYGSSAIAGNAATTSLEGFVAAGTSALNAATVSFMGQNIGAKKTKRVIKVFFICIIITVIYSVTLGGGIYAFGGMLVKAIFCPNDPEAVKVAVLKMQYLLTTYSLIAAINIIAAGLQSLGYSTLTMINSVIGICGFRLIWMNYVYPMSPSLDTLYVCYPISWILLITANIVCFIFAYKKYKRTGAVK